MKKILSFVLAFGMMLSALSIIPVQAAPTEDYPYIYEDFATDKGKFDSGKWVEEGAHGASGALYVTQTKDAQDVRIYLPDTSILQGKFKMSAWVKIDTAKTKLAKGQFGFIFWAPAIAADGTVTKTSWEMDWVVNADLEALNRGEWVYVEKIIDKWDGGMRHGQYAPDVEGAVFQFAPRLGSPGDGKLENILTKDSPTQENCWYLDDFIVEPIVEPYGATTVQDGSNVLVDVDFSEALSAYNSQISISANDGAIENGYFHFKTNGGTYNNINIREQPLKYNKIYKATFRAKANDDATVGSLMKFVAIRKGYQDANDKQYHYQFVRAMDAETKAEGKLTKEWRNYELYMTRQVKAAYHQPLTFIMRCVGPVKTHDDFGKEAVDFMIDDIKFEELPTVTNGDFEWLKGDLPTTMEDSNMNNNDSKLYGTFYGWRDVDATVATVAGHDSSRAAKVTVNKQNGHIEQGIYIQNNSENVIKFWAKGEGDSVGKSIQLKLDRDVDVKDERDVYNVNTEVIGDGLVLTDEWKEYSVRYDLKAATPSGANKYAEPRSPFLSFVVDGGAAGLTYYVDDVEVGPYVAPYSLPYATDLMLEGVVLAGETVTFSYLYNHDTEEMEGNSVVRILKKTEDGHYVTMAQRSEMSAFYDYLIPESMVGSKLKFEILPATEPDGNGKVTYGAVYALETDAVKPAFVVTPALGAFNEESGSVTGTLKVENNKLTGDNLDMFLAIVLYDAEGGIVRYDFKPVSAAAGATENVTLSVSAADVEGLEPVASAKAFTWNGTGIFDTDLTSMAETITVTR